LSNPRRWRQRKADLKDRDGIETASALDAEDSV
jgi:hypothetical protein